MMISPEGYYESELKGKDEQQIQSAIRRLKREIGHLKNVIEHPDYGLQPVCCPFEKVKISCNREYLERAKQALSEVGGTYKPSQAEFKVLDFQENIECISKITFSIGTYFYGSTEYVLEIDEDNVQFTSSKFGDILEEKQLDKDELISSLERLYIGEWRKSYDPMRFGYAVLDVTQWEVSIEYNNGRKTNEYYGSNSYPYNFIEFIDLFELDDNAEILDLIK